MKRDAGGLCGGCYLCPQHDEFRWIDLGQRQSSHERTAFVVEVGDQVSCEKYSKGTRKPDVAVLQARGLKRMHHDTCIFHTVEFAAGASGKPLRVEIAGLAGPQLNQRAIDLGLQITRRTIAPGSQRRLALGIQSRFGTVHPKNNRCLTRISFVLFVAEALDHGIPAVAVHHGQPAWRRVQPQFGGHVHIVQREETVVPDGDRRIFCGTEPHVVAVEIAAGRIRRSEGPEIVADSRGSVVVGGIVL
jgi:hypothetical protein